MCLRAVRAGGCILRWGSRLWSSHLVCGRRTRRRRGKSHWVADLPPVRDPGLVLFVAGFALFGLLRDWVVSRSIAQSLIIFGGGAMPWVVDYAAWFMLVALAMAVQFGLSLGANARPALECG